MKTAISSRHAETVKRIYEWFGRGEAEKILAEFSPDVEFRLAEGHPYQPSGAPWIGHDEVVRNFFMKAGPEWENWTVDLHATHEIDDVVVSEGRYRGVYKPTGKTMDVQVCHVWTFRDGKIASFHQYLDSARLQDVMGRR